MNKKCILFACIGLILAMPVLAERSNWYKVELIVFQHATSKTLLAEHWPRSISTFDLKNVVQLQPPDATGMQTAYSALPATSFTLNAEAEKIAKTPQYKVLLHTAWLQPLEATETSHGVYLHSEVDHQGEGLVLANEDPVAGNNGHLWQLEGVFSLKRSRFFHLSQELLLRLPVEEDVNENGLWNSTRQYLKTFRLKASTRMKEDQLHYIDHPVFGVIALITPTEPPSLVSSDLGHEEESAEGGELTS